MEIEHTLAVGHFQSQPSSLQMLRTGMFSVHFPLGGQQSRYYAMKYAHKSRQGKGTKEKYCR